MFEVDEIQLLSKFIFNIGLVYDEANNEVAAIGGLRDAKAEANALNDEIEDNYPDGDIPNHFEVIVLEEDLRNGEAFFELLADFCEHVSGKFMKDPQRQKEYMCKTLMEGGVIQRY